MTKTTANEQIGVGIIGCGKISQAYFNGAGTFEILKIIACADLNEAAAQAKAEENGCEALSVEALLAHPDIDLVINLTIPAAHAEVSIAALKAGKHVYCEKPLTVELNEADEILALAKEKQLLVGCAPDTFLGAGHQTCRKLVDEDAIGRVVAGTAFMLSPGHESWHPNPAFYYQRGGGPVFDMGPYYLTALVNLIGPVKRVCAITSRALDERTVGSGERKGEVIPVEVPTHASATLEFHNGAVVTAVFSFDVPAHEHSPIELYGTKGALQAPDPNGFGGPVRLHSLNKKENWQEQELSHIYEEDHRSIGAADMAYAIAGGRPHRTSGNLAYHILEVMHAFDEASQSGKHVTIQSKPKRPAPLPLGLDPGKLDA
ncbi:MAG: Gfo/Idh/MocA family protein [Opitutales bacterium]